VLRHDAACRYINNEVLSRFRGFGGVRLEDVVVVREVRLLALCVPGLVLLSAEWSVRLWPVSQ
jgi:hypothetical protein